MNLALLVCKDNYSSERAINYNTMDNGDRWWKNNGTATYTNFEHNKIPLLCV